MLRYTLSPLSLNAVCVCGAEVACKDVQFDGEVISGRAEHECGANIFREWREEINVFGASVSDYFARDLSRGRKMRAL